jgi:hypothetical protein
VNFILSRSLLPGKKRFHGYVVPDSFTHGTSAQRTKWFLKGFKTGDPSQGDTFAPREL